MNIKFSQKLMVCLFILSLLIGCDKDKIWRTYSKLECDINGMQYIDNPLRFPFTVLPTTPELSAYRKGDWGVITFTSICDPKEQQNLFPSYRIVYQLFDTAVVIGKKYIVSSIPSKEIDYYQDNKISWAAIINQNTAGRTYGDGYIIFTEWDKENEWINGKIELKVLAPIQNVDSMLNITGRFIVRFRGFEKSIDF